MKIDSFVRAADLADLDAAGPLAVSPNGVPLVVVRTSAGLRAFEGRCPHQGTLLGEGELDGDRLVCRAHGWRFRIDSGRRDGGPECLASYRVVEKDGAIFIDLDRAPSGMAPDGHVRQLDELPGPPGLPVLGNFLQIKLARFHLVLERWAAEYGPTYQLRIGKRRVIVIADPKSCDQILRARPDRFSRGTQSTIFSELNLDGVFSSEGEPWRRQRKLTVAVLSQRNVRGLYSKIQTVTARLLERWRRQADSGAALDLVEELKRYTVDVTTLLTFGYDANSIERDGDLVQQKLGHGLSDHNPTRFLAVSALALSAPAGGPALREGARGTADLARRIDRRRARAARRRARTRRAAVEFYRSDGCDPRRRGKPVLGRCDIRQPDGDVARPARIRRRTPSAGPCIICSTAPRGSRRCARRRIASWAPARRRPM